MVYYLGTLEDYQDERLWLAQKYELYIYSEDIPSDGEHKYWHYDANKQVVIWE